MRWRVWLGNIMEMYRTANPGMTVRPRPWPRRVECRAARNLIVSNTIQIFDFCWVGLLERRSFLRKRLPPIFSQVIEAHNKMFFPSRITVANRPFP